MTYTDDELRAALDAIEGLWHHSGGYATDGETARAILDAVLPDHDRRIQTETQVRTMRFYANVLNKSADAIEDAALAASDEPKGDRCEHCGTSLDSCQATKAESQQPCCRACQGDASHWQKSSRDESQIATAEEGFAEWAEATAKPDNLEAWDAVEGDDDKR